MKTVLFVLAFLFISPLLFAQDYYLTADKNATPITVNSITDMPQLLKAQGKDKKYQSVVLSFSNGEGLFVLAPLTFDREITLEGISLTDKNDEDYYIDISVKNISDNPKEDYEKFKKEATSASAKIISEKDILIRAKRVKEVIFSMPKGVAAAGYMFDYKKNFLFITQGTDKNIAQHSDEVKKIIASLGVVHTAQYTASAPTPNIPATKASAKSSAANIPAQPAAAGQSVALAAPSAEVENPAITAMKQAGLSTAQDVEDTDIHSLKVTAQGSKANKVAFKYAGGSYSVVAPSDINVTLQDGRIYFATPRRGKNIMYLEVPSQKSKTFYASAVKDYGEGHVLKAQPAQSVKLGGNTVRLIRKTALNKSANNYFIKKGSNFVLSYIVDSKDDGYFDGVAKAILTSFTQD